MFPICEINSLGERLLNASMSDLAVCQVAPTCWNKYSTKSIVSTTGKNFSFSISPDLSPFPVIASPLWLSKKNGPMIEVAVSAQQLVSRDKWSGTNLFFFGFSYAKHLKLCLLTDSSNEKWRNEISKKFWVFISFLIEPLARPLPAFKISVLQ